MLMFPLSLLPLSLFRAPTPSRRIIAAAPARRFSSSEAAKPSPPPPPPEPPAKSGGSSFLQRLTAFFTGAGLGGGLGYYHLAAVSEAAGSGARGAAADSSKIISRNCSCKAPTVGIDPLSFCGWSAWVVGAKNDLKFPGSFVRAPFSRERCRCASRGWPPPPPGAGRRRPVSKTGSRGCFQYRTIAGADP